MLGSNTDVLEIAVDELQVELYACAVAGRSEAYLAVVKGDGPTWLYDVIAGSAGRYDTMEAAKKMLPEGASYVGVEASEVPPHVAGPFGTAMMAMAMEAAAVAMALGAKVRLGSSVQNIMKGDHTGVSIQAGDIKGGLVFGS